MTSISNSKLAAERCLLSSSLNPGYALGRWHRRSAALDQIQRLTRGIRPASVDPYFVALIYLGLGDREQTFEWLNKALDFRSPFLIATLSDPRWEVILPDRRFASLTQRMNIRH